MWNRFDAHRDALKLQYRNHHWDPDTGLELSALEAGCQKIRQTLAGESILRIKTAMMVYLLEHAQLQIEEEEFFQDQLNIGNIMNRFLLENHDARLPDAIKPIWPDKQALWDCSSMEASMDFGHLAPDWKFLLSAGIPGVLARLEAYRKENPGKEEFYDCCTAVWEGVARLTERMAAACEKIPTEKMAFVAGNLRHLAHDPPQTLAQVMELSLLTYRLQTFLDQAIVRSLGGLDRLYFPYYRHDLENGFTAHQLRELTRDFLWKISAMAATANMPFYIGGLDENGQDAGNGFTDVILAEYRDLNLADPKFHVLCHPDMPEKRLETVLDMIRGGNSSFCFVNVAAASRALRTVGISEADAKKVILYGCYEPASEGEEIPATCGGKLNLPKIVELALHNGVDPLTGNRLGPETGLEFDSFAAFLQAVRAQLEHAAKLSMDTITAYEGYYDRVNPAPLLSATYHTCVEQGKEIFSGGAKYNNTSIVAAGLATAADSLAAIRKLIFEEKRVTFPRLREILTSNWAAEPELREICWNRYPKFGNQLPETDKLGEALLTWAGAAINCRPNGRGGVFRLGAFTVDWRFGMGKKVGATPDGRLAGEAFSKNFCATVGKDLEGVTAFLNTVLTLDAAGIPDGSVADVVLHSSAVSGAAGMAALKGLLRTFLSGGGFALQFSVLNLEMLRRAQREPDKYRNIQVRLCGWNAYFVDLRKEEQDHFIESMERGKGL